MDKSTKALLEAEAELLRYHKEILDNLRGLGQVPWKGFLNNFDIFTLMLRRRESYLLGELRGVLISLQFISEQIDKNKLRGKS